jgi:hypothetical protein
MFTLIGIEFRGLLSIAVFPYLLRLPNKFETGGTMRLLLTLTTNLGLLGQLLETKLPAEQTGTRMY